MAAIAWESLYAYMVERIPAVLPIAGKKKLSLVVGKGAATLALRIPRHDSGAIEPSSYKELSFDVRTVDGVEIFELKTSTADLFHSFYLFATAVASLIEEGDASPQDAIREALGKFGQLLMQRELMPLPVQLGLFGELHLLRGLLEAIGLSAFGSWLGPLNERHDFRFGKHEVEVKSTTKTSREHVINGLDQLEASPGKLLHILSLQYELAGPDAGMTLPGLVDAVRKLIHTDVKTCNEFDGLLARLGYRNLDAGFYTSAWQLGTAPVLVPVNDDCPRLTRTGVSAAIGNDMCNRIVNAEYVINVSGLGFPVGSKAYRAILPVDNLKER